MKSFLSTLEEGNITINRLPVEILQVNIGHLCNLACLHCHVEAGPNKKENMESDTVDRIIDLLAKSEAIHTLDLTGGAPELNPHFRRLVIAATNMGKKVIDRCNLTVLYEKGQEDTAEFLKNQKVHIVASLPCYSLKNVEQQRGRGVFQKSIDALIQLNELGYGRENSDLKLDLVYNPLGAHLPPSQSGLSIKYKQELNDLFGIQFNQLLTITNMPIKRFLHDLERSHQYDSYMDLLVNSFNPRAAEGVMCRNLVSISWDGKIYDCDFNQMLELRHEDSPRTIWDISSFDKLSESSIYFDNHCYACTAGSGSSCSGAVLDQAEVAIHG
ncbi:MAG: radical SAM/Cys-rich domain protein [Leptospira sp.]|nr:radical SAM/Cys-rich domain protein [Leptospira sp.]